MAFGGVGRPDRKGFDIILYQQHQDRLKKMKPTVDCGPPRPHPLSNKSEMEKVTTKSIRYIYIVNSYDIFC